MLRFDLVLSELVVFFVEMSLVLAVVFIICGILIASNECRTSEKLRVNLENGSKLLGRYLTSSDGKGVRAFLGVPYAEPPIGALRWKVDFVIQIT